MMFPMVFGVAASAGLRLGQTYKHEVLASLPLGYWRLDDVSPAAIAVDASGNGLDGAYHGSPTLEQSPLINDGTAVIFDGVDDWIEVNDQRLNLTGDVTIEAWVNLPTINGIQPLIEFTAEGETEATNSIYHLQLEDGELGNFWEYGTGSTVYTKSGVVLSTSTVYYLICARDSTSKEVRFYVDGVLRATKSYTNSPSGGTSATLRIGHGNSSAQWALGTVDEVAIYPRALTENEIRRHFWAGKGKGGYELEVLASGPEGYWRLGESSGTTANDELGNHQATYVGGVTLGADALISSSDTAIELNGTSGYVDLSTLTFDPASGSFAVEVWHKTPTTLPTTSNSTIYAQRDGAGTGRSWLYSDDNGGDGFGSHRLVTDLDGVAQDAGATLAADTLYHFVLCYDSVAGKLAVYVNGAQTAEVSVTPEAATGGHLIGVQKSLAADFLSGPLDESAFYSRALTPTEIRRHYYRGLGEIGYKLEVLSSGPEAYWRLDELAGPTMADASGNGMNGTYSGGTFEQTGLLTNDSNKAVKITGGEYLNVANNAALDNTSATYELWFSLLNLPSGNGFGVIGRADSTRSYNGFILSIYDGRIGLSIKNGSSTVVGYRGATALAIGVTYHVVICLAPSGVEANIYVNGSLEASAATSSSWGFNNQALRVGRMIDSYWESLPAIVDEIAVYPGELSPEEIRRHYAVGKYGFE